MRFRLTPRSMTLDDLDILSEFRVNSRFLEPIATKRMKIDS